MGRIDSTRYRTDPSSLNRHRKQLHSRLRVSISLFRFGFLRIRFLLPDHLSKKNLCFNSETNLDRILKNLESEPSISSLTVFEMNEKELKNLENRIPMILSSESKTILRGKLNLKFQKEKDSSIFKGVVATRYDKRL